MSTLPERLKIIRAELGKTQKELAALLGISYSSLQFYEGGRSVPGGDVLEALIRLGFSSDWVLTGEGHMKRAIAPSADMVAEPSGPAWVKSGAGLHLCTPEKGLLVGAFKILDRFIAKSPVPLDSEAKAELFEEIFEDLAKLKDSEKVG